MVDTHNQPQVAVIFPTFERLLLQHRFQRPNFHIIAQILSWESLGFELVRVDARVDFNFLLLEVRRLELVFESVLDLLFLSVHQLAAGSKQLFDVVVLKLVEDQVVVLNFAGVAHLYFQHVSVLLS